MAKYSIAEMKGQGAVIAFHAFLGLTINIVASKKIHSLIEPQDSLKALTDGGMDSIEYISMLFDALRELDDKNAIKKHIFCELIAFADKEEPEYLKLLQIAKDNNGAAVSRANIGSFTAGELTEMLYQCFCACLSHESSVFF